MAGDNLGKLGLGRCSIEKARNGADVKHFYKISYQDFMNQPKLLSVILNMGLELSTVTNKMLMAEANLNQQNANNKRHNTQMIKSPLTNVQAQKKACSVRDEYQTVVTNKAPLAVKKSLLNQINSNNAMISVPVGANIINIISESDEENDSALKQHQNA